MFMSKIHYYDRIRLRPLHSTESTDEDDLCIQIVYPQEADAVAGRISAEAPVGQAALHRKEGEIITFNAQGQRMRMKIISIEKHAVTA